MAQTLRNEVAQETARVGPTLAPAAPDFPLLERRELERRNEDSELRLKEAQLSEALRVARLAYWEYDVLADKFYFNDQFYAVMRTTAEREGSRTMSAADYARRFLPVEETPLVAAEIQKALAATDPHYHRELDHRAIFGDGQPGHIAVHVRIVKDAHGRTIRLHGANMDITERKHTEEQLRLRSTAVEAAANAIFITGRAGLILWANPAFTAISGYTMAEAVGRMPNLVKSGTHDTVFYDELWHTISAGRVWQGEITNRRKNGTLYLSHQTISPVADDRGAITHFVTVQKDITERKATEERLREQADLLDKAHDAIIVRDLDHRIRYWNKSAERIYGWTAAEMLGRQVNKMFYRDDTEFRPAMLALLKEGVWAGELTQLRKNGTEITLDASWTLVRDAQGNPASVLAINTDVTDRKRLEAQFLRAQRLESIGTLAAGISHDLNNVLAPILMSVALLRLKHPDPESQKLLTMLESNAQRGSQMVRQVLAFGRGGIEGERMLIQPAHIAREVAQIVQDTFPKSIRLEHHFTHDLWPIIGDPTQLHQILLNLCVNARDAMPAGGRLSIRLENLVLDESYAGMNPGCTTGPHALLSVTDTGTGIDPAIREKIFDPFFTTKDKGKGTGLGLSTVLALVKGHGGFVNLYSEKGEGSTFKIYLPATTTPGADVTVAVAHSGLPRGNGEMILLVDDEEAVRLVAQKMLERFGYRVLLAANGAEAVSHYAVHREEIGVVITDMAMPVMDGPATILALRTINPDVKIIGSSGMGSTSHNAVAKAVGVGLGQFIPKPYAADVLLKELHKILSRGHRPPPGPRDGADA